MTQFGQARCDAFRRGTRLCPGRYLATLEMNLVLGMLGRNFELLEVAGPSGAVPEEVLTFTMHPGGLRMRLKKHVVSA